MSPPCCCDPVGEPATCGVRCVSVNGYRDVVAPRRGDEARKRAHDPRVWGVTLATPVLEGSVKREPRRQPTSTKYTQGAVPTPLKVRGACNWTHGRAHLQAAAQAATHPTPRYEAGPPGGSKPFDSVRWLRGVRSRRASAAASQAGAARTGPDARDTTSQGGPKIPLISFDVAPVLSPIPGGPS
eukprot:scaffold952_cov409-Prasinococcus_capsulatus_cf.AAC.60